MKRICLIVLIVLNCILLNAQEPNNSRSLRFGVNGAFYGAGDLIGPGIYAEYIHPVNAYLAITPRVFSGFANSFEEYDSRRSFDHISSFGVNLSARFTPMPKSFNRLKIDAGALYHHMINSYGNDVNFIHYSNDSYNDSYYSNDHAFGLSGSICLDVIRTAKTESGFRLDMLTSFYQGSFNCDSWQMGVYFGVKL